MAREDEVVNEDGETEAEALAYRNLEVSGRRLRDAIHAYAADLKARDLAHGSNNVTVDEIYEEIAEVLNQEWGGPPEDLAQGAE